MSCVVLIAALAASLSAADWDPALPFESRFRSTVEQRTQERPPQPSQTQPLAALSEADTAREARWIALQLGLSSDATYEANPAAVAEIARFLKGVRAAFPEIAGLPAAYPLGTSVNLSLTDAAEAAVASGVSVPTDKYVVRIAPPALGLQELDAAVSALKGSYKVSVYKSGRVSVNVELGRELDIAKVVRRLETIPQVRAAGGDMMIIGGPGAPIVERAGSLWRLKLTHGWGDCMAGCINREAWFFSFAEDEGPRWVAYTRNAGDTLVVRPR